MASLLTRRALFVGGAVVLASGASACRAALFREPLKASDRRDRRRVLIAATGPVQVTFKGDNLLKTGPLDSSEVETTRHASTQRQLVDDGLNPPKRVQDSFIRYLEELHWEVVLSDPPPPGAVPQGGVFDVELAADVRAAAAAAKADSVFLLHERCSARVRGGILSEPWLSEVRSDLWGHVFDTTTGRKLFQDVIWTNVSVTPKEAALPRFNEVLDRAAGELFNSFRAT
jgi:hypothetical protein